MKAPTFAPAYVGLFPILAEVAQANGYALAVHGSVSRDFDLVAIPWTPDAVETQALVDAIAKQCAVSFGNLTGAYALALGPEAKPHGRIAWTITLEMGATIDLSVMPRLM